MSAAVVMALAVAAAVACAFVMLTLFALLRVAAYSDAQRERERDTHWETAMPDDFGERPATGRFARRRDGAREREGELLG